MKLAFDVGEMEKHQVEFSWNQFWGTSRLAVDGKTVHTSGIQLSSPCNVIEQAEVPRGWKVRVPYAFTRDDWRRFLPFHYDYIDVELIRRWTIPVGAVEKHQIVIEKERERWCAGLRPQKYRIFIDETLVKECRGY